MIHTPLKTSAWLLGVAVCALTLVPIAHAQDGGVAGQTRPDGVPTEEPNTDVENILRSEPVLEDQVEDVFVPDNDEVVATGVFIPNEKRITSEITSVLDAGDFATIGASDIGAALTRVTGVSISQGKFPVVRGLNERYTSVSLNGSPLPSPEPLRKVAPLDLFPTSTLDDVVVAKTSSPELTGEFGGGNIALKTRAIPVDNFLEVSISGSVDTETTLQQGFKVNGSDTDFLGFSSDGVRALPALDDAGDVIQPTFDGTTVFTGGNVNSFDTAVVVEQDNLPGNFGGRVTGGLRHDFDNGMSAGVIVTAGYANSWEVQDGVDNSFFESGGELVFSDQTDEISTENEVEANLFIGAGLEIDENNTIILTGLGTRSTEIETRIQEGVSFDFDEGFRRESSEFIEREAYFGQLRGEHYIPSLNDMEIQWRGSYSIADRDSPLERFTLFEPVNAPEGSFTTFNSLTPFAISDDTNSNGLNFANLEDENYDVGLDIVYPFTAFDRETSFKVGTSYVDKRRETDQLFFRYNDINGAFLGLRPDVLFSDTLLAANAVPGVSTLSLDRVGGIGFPELSEAELDIFSAYAGLDTELTPDIRISGGLRYEESDQSTAVGNAFVDTPLFEFEPLNEDFLLPSGTLTWTFAENWQLRLAASQTINRPQFREITPTLFINSETDENFLGNPTLRNSDVTNLDARVEYYFASNQFITVGGFYKDLTDPIEEINLEIGESDATGFINAPSAEIYGVELEFEKRFGFDELGFLPFFDGNNFDRTFVIRSNYTFSQSDASADGDITAVVSSTASVDQPVTIQTFDASELFVDGRRLQGQSDHIINLQLGVEDDLAGWEASFLLNYQSERTRLIDSISTTVDGANILLDVPVEEQLPVTVNFVFNWERDILGAPYVLGFKVDNILGDDYESFRELNGQKAFTDTYEVGTVFSASLKRTF